MDFPIIIAVFGALAIGVLFLLARRALKLVVRLALFGALALVLLIGGLAWWLFGSRDRAARQNDNRPANTRRGPTR